MAQQHAINTNYDDTIVQIDDSPRSGGDLPFTPVAVATGSAAAPRNVQYIAQQTSFDDYTPGLNPLVNAASQLLLQIVRIRALRDTDLESLRILLEAEVRGFNAQARAAGISEAQVTAAQYLLCTALDESVTSSTIPGAQGEWQHRSLLSTFHRDTWGGEVFYDVLNRTMEQPASRLYLLELIYLLLSLGFEGKYKTMDRGPLAIESLRDQLYRQIRMLRGEPTQELSKKLAANAERTKVYAYIPGWLVALGVVFCIGVTFWGFSKALAHKSAPILEQLAQHNTRMAPVPALLSQEAEASPTDDTAPALEVQE